MPSLQFVITDRMSLLSPLNANGRSIPLSAWKNKNNEKKQDKIIVVNWI